MWPAIVAHRGASAQHRENTLSAFEAAVGAGVDFVELDVRRCRDGGLAVAHDPTIEANGGVAISDLTLAELKRLQPDTPSLDEVLEVLRGRVALEVDICTWEVDDPAAIERLFELGADAVETNDPAVGVAVRDRVRSRMSGGRWAS
jgi:glycerophosphoryl diester phosphodiesterase